MTYEELEKLKKDHDYCIIPIENILGIEDNMPIQGLKLRTINVDANKEEPCQFVNSDYFRTWGKGFHFEEKLSSLIEEAQRLERDIAQERNKSIEAMDESRKRAKKEEK